MVYDRIKLVLVGFLSLVFSTITPFSFAEAINPSVQSDKPLVSLFPIENYDQTISNWINPNNPDYQTPLLTAAQQAVWRQEFYNRAFGSQSPWSQQTIDVMFQPSGMVNKTYDSVQSQINALKGYIDAQAGYGINFRIVTNAWLQAQIENINIEQFRAQSYSSDLRGILIDNVQARAIPTDEPMFLYGTVPTKWHPGEGFPFDNLQYTAVWAGTPIYILGKSVDGLWYYVKPPDFTAGWVPSNKVALVDDSFVKEWQATAQQPRGLMAVVKTNIGIKDPRAVTDRFAGYIGMVLPGKVDETGKISIKIPIMGKYQHAHSVWATPADQSAFVVMPLSATPEHFIQLISTVKNKPYGWGSEYFFNDCSSELRNLYAVFGIRLPRNSFQQSKVGTLLNLNDDNHILDSSNPMERMVYIDSRIETLKQQGHPFLSIIYIGGHVMMYLGHYSHITADATQPVDVALTYQNIWGFRAPVPTTGPDQGKDLNRDIIGESVLLPLLNTYPNDDVSLAAKPIFEIIHLDQPNQEAVYD